MKHVDKTTLHNNFRLAAEALKASAVIFFTTHERTDGDDLGTVLALAQTLQTLNKTVYIGVIGGVPKQLKFLPGSDKVTEGISKTCSPDCIVISGCSDLKRANIPELSSMQCPIINFDHHPDNELFGEINVVDPEASSVSELMYEFIQANKWPINQNIATCLLAGIMTDTGSFMHSNTKISTLRIASTLLIHGARTPHIAKQVFGNKDMKTLKAWSLALQNTWIAPESGMICGVIDSHDLEALGNPPQSVFQEFVESINKVPEAKFAMFLKQDGNLVKGSLRSDPHKPGGGIDVGALARLFGGGGHKFASGFAIPGKLVKLQGQGYQIQAL